MGHITAMHSPAVSVTNLPGLFVDPDLIFTITVFVKLNVKFLSFLTAGVWFTEVKNLSFSK